jgi:glucosyl-3-phosphoglycerate synthase
MSEFYQTGLVATFHQFGNQNLERLEKELLGISPQRPIALVLPSLYSELEGPALPHIVEELKQVPALAEIVVTMGRTSAEEFQKAKRFFAPLPQRSMLIWNDGPRVQSHSQRHWGLEIGVLSEVRRNTSISATTAERKQNDQSHVACV